jgi:hypothetical protein
MINWMMRESRSCCGLRKSWRALDKRKAASSRGDFHLVGELGMAMHFSRFQIALLCVALTLASLALSRVMTVKLEALKADVLGEPRDAD